MCTGTLGFLYAAADCLGIIDPAQPHQFEGGYAAFWADAIGFQDDVHEIQCCEKKKTSVGRADELIDEQANKLAGDW